MKKIVLFLVAAMLVAGIPAFALDAPMDNGLAKLADNDSYAVKVPGMMLYGMYEIGEAPLESLHQPYEQTFEKKDYALGLFKGLNKGLFNFLEGTTRGLFDILRSPVPGMRRFEHKDNQTRVL